MRLQKLRSKSRNWRTTSPGLLEMLLIFSDRGATGSKLQKSTLRPKLMPLIQIHLIPLPILPLLPMLHKNLLVEEVWDTQMCAGVPASISSLAAVNTAVHVAFATWNTPYGSQN